MSRPIRFPIHSRKRNGGDDESKRGAPEDDGTQAGEGPDSVRARLATARLRDFHRFKKTHRSSICFSGPWNQVHSS